MIQFLCSQGANRAQETKYRSLDTRLESLERCAFSSGDPKLVALQRYVESLERRVVELTSPGWNTCEDRIGILESKLDSLSSVWQ